MEAKEIFRQIKNELKENLSEIISGFFVMVLMLLLSYKILKGQIAETMQYLTLTVIGCGIILVVGFEKRGKVFDRFVSMIVIFFLALSFMFL